MACLETNPKALALSFILQGSMVAILMSLGTADAVREPVAQVTLIAPLPVVRLAPRKSNSGGGGGQHSQLPPLKGQFLKPAPKTFIPPLVTIEHPNLILIASLAAPPDAWLPATNVVGNPLGMVGGASGPGSRGGTGVGDGPGPGEGKNDIGGAGIFSVGSGVTPPAVLSKVDPEYSEEARKAKYSGSVMLSIVVNTDGRADNIRVVRSLGMGLDEKAVEAVQRWRFRPGMNKGAPVRVRAQIEVNFRLL